MRALGSHAGGPVQWALVLGWLPGIGGDMRVAPDLLSVAQGQRRYALLVQKQPGTDGTPSPSGIDGEMLTFELDLATDVAVEIAYE